MDCFAFVCMHLGAFYLHVKGLCIICYIKSTPCGADQKTVVLCTCLALNFPLKSFYSSKLLHWELSMCRNIVPTLNSTSKQKWCYVDYCIHFCFRHPVLYDAYTEMLLTYTEIFVLGTFDSAEISHHRNLHPHS